MRRLIAALRARLHTRLHRQRVADLEITLSELITARQHIDRDIERIVLELVAIKSNTPIASEKPQAGMVDRAFPDVSPRSY